MSLKNKTSIRVPSQLPEFVRDDLSYETFVAFTEAYYEWMELNDAANANTSLVSTSNQGVTFGSKNLSSYYDVDSTLDDFLTYFIRDFLPNFPEETLTDKQKVLKIARQLYQSKGTPASYKLLFRLLYNSDAELQFTRDLVFRASSGEWYVPKYLILKSNNTNWTSTSTKTLKIFGETSKSFATIDSVIATNSVDKFNAYISAIQRGFVSGENIRGVDSNNQDVYFKEGSIVSSTTSGAELLSAKIVGVISDINIDTKYRGLNYKVGDPVVIYGGLNTPDGIGASAEVSETTKGSIQRLNIVQNGHGYRTTPNSSITFTGGGGSGAQAIIASVNESEEIANVTFVGTDIIALKSHIQLNANSFNFAANLSANAATTLANALTFISFSTSPIDSVIVVSEGAGYTSVPEITAKSLYSDELPSDTLWIKDGVIYESNVAGSFPISSNTHNLISIGILSPVQITSAGEGYVVDDKIVFSGGTGVGAFANVTAVGLDGEITSIEYVPNYIDDSAYPLGGMGYTNQSLPSLSVLSSNVNATGAELSIPVILGSGAEFNAQTDRVGAITNIKINEPGEDYVSDPSTSFKVQDLVVTNISGDFGSVRAGDEIKQGTDPTFNYTAFVDSVEILLSTVNPEDDIYRIRTYNYKGNLELSNTITIYSETSNSTMHLSTAFDSVSLDNSTFQNGIKTYGNGLARGSVNILQGLIFAAGRYLTTVGQPSSYSVLQSEIYNDFTYVLSVQSPISKYRDLLKSLLHPAGLRVIGRDLLKNDKQFDFHKYSGQGQIYPLQYWLNWPTGDNFARVSMNTDGSFSNTNIVYVSSDSDSSSIFNNLSNNDFIIIENSVGPVISSRINSLDSANLQIVLDDDVWLTYPNVAYAYSNTDTGTLQISDFNIANTPNYDIVNNKNYSDSNNHIKDIVFKGDNITIAGNTYIVMGVDYDNHLITIVNQEGLLAFDPDRDLLLTDQPVANNINLGEFLISAGTKENPVPFTINRNINTTQVYIRKTS